MNEVARPHAAAGVMAIVLRTIVSATVMLLPIVFTFAALDPWVIPKIAVFRASAVILTALTIASALAFPRSIARPALRKIEIITLAAIVALSVLATFVTTDRVHSIDALITVLCAVAFFVVATIALRDQPPALTLAVVTVPVIANTVFVALQALNIWNPVAKVVTWAAPTDVRTGFLGNPNFLGTFLATPVLLLLLFTLTEKRIRIWSGAAFVIAMTGFLLSRTLTAIIAFLAAAVVLAIIRWRRNALVAGAGVAVLMLATIFASSSLRHRLFSIYATATQGQYDRILSGRLISYATAAEMIRDRPLLGVGLGCFELQYMSYNRTALQHHPSLNRSVSRGVNFGQTHNEPLQYWAETGVAGAALFVLVMVLLARRGRNADPVRRVLAPSFAVLLFVLSLAQFPFHIPAPLAMNLYVAAFVCAHDPRD